MKSCNTPLIGQIALQCGKSLPVLVYKSYAGYYLGTYDEEGPFSRESEEYWRKEADARKALDSGNWTQRPHL